VGLDGETAGADRADLHAIADQALTGWR